jgi:hypothetical protein
MMNLAFAHDYIARRMEELGYGNNYYLRVRHIVLKPLENRTLNADNQLWLLLDAVDSISIQSEFGVFDLAAYHINELQYEHQGKIVLNNYSANLKHLIFIQVIPKQN